MEVACTAQHQEMEKYEFVQRIAEGAYGTVWKCVDKETGAIRAVKKLKEAPANSEVWTQLPSWAVQDWGMHSCIRIPVSYPGHRLG